MILLIIIIFAVIIAIFLFNYFDSPELKKTIMLDENKIVKKFNNLLKHISPRNIETVKKDLIDTLDEYKAVKKAQFIDARTLITSSIDSVKQELAKVDEKCTIKKQQIIDSRGKVNEVEGAQMCYDWDLYRITHTNLTKSLETLNTRLTELDRKVIQFDSSLHFKRSQIIAMIADSIAIKDYSVIDLRLESLETEFKNEVNKAENARIVNEKMEHIEDKSPKFDFDYYKKMFNEFGS